MSKNTHISVASSSEILPLVFFTSWMHRPRSALSCSSGISIPAASTFITMSCSTASLNSRRQIRFSVSCTVPRRTDASAGGR